MNESPPNRDDPDDIDDRYRRASAQDPSRPSEHVRRAVFGHAAQLAADRTSAKRRPRFNWRSAANHVRRRPAMIGTLAAAALAGLLVTPYFLSPGEPPTAAVRPAASYAPTTAVNATPPSPFPEQVRGMAKVADGAAARREQAVRSESVAPNKSVARGEAVSESRIAAQNMPEAGVGAAAARMTDSRLPLRQAAEIGDLRQLRTALESHADVDARDTAGRTALMLATLHGQLGAVELLLAHGADPNAADAQGRTPLQVAEAGDQRTIAAALRRAGGK